MENSQNLGLPYIAPSQAQKHVTHNEAIRMIDALLQNPVSNLVTTEPPSDPKEGDSYIIGSGQGDWAQRDNSIAVFQDGAWAYFQPKEGWIVFDKDTSKLNTFTGEGWTAVEGPDTQNQLTAIGIMAEASNTSRLVVSSHETTLTHEGSNHQVTVNKAAQADTASVLYKNNWSTRAEIGLVGSDALSFKTSADGVTFTEAMRIEPGEDYPTFDMGIKLGGSVLSHYEQGEWMPELSFGGETTGIVYDFREGRFVRIGDLLHLQCGIKLADKGTAVGHMQIGNLPFDAASTYYPGSVFVVGGGIDLSGVVCRVLPGRKLSIRNTGPSGLRVFTDANCSDALNFRVSITYFV